MVIAIIIFLLLSIVSVFLSNLLDLFFSIGNLRTVLDGFPGIWDCLEHIKTIEKCRTMWIILEGFSLLASIAMTHRRNADVEAKQMKVTDTVSIPLAAGQGQHGTARFMNHKEMQKTYQGFTFNLNDSYFRNMKKTAADERAAVLSYVKVQREENKTKRQKFSEWACWKSDLHRIKKGKVATNGFKIPLKQRLKWKVSDLALRIGIVRKASKCDTMSQQEKANYFKKAGIVINMEIKNGNEIINMLTDDTHSLTIGQTASGKSRCLVIQSICSLALAGESIIATDPKGELFAYTSRYLEELGYNVCVIDFQNPELSGRSNPLQTIIDAVNENDITAAQSRTWDLVSFLVEKNERSEPIWSNGEMSVLAAAILCVVYDNKENPQFQNMTNVYWFMSEMCKDVKTPANTVVKPIRQYISNLPNDHPAKPLLSIADVAPDKTAGSFYTSALSTMRLFVSNEIYGVTAASDFSFTDFGDKKQALFFILPDQKTTYYPIVTLYVAQIYDALVERAKKCGNRLKNRVNFILDEFGNFTKISDFDTKLTVGRGYGIRFNLFLQDFAQLKAKYGAEAAEIIKGNCAVWIFLSTANKDTLEEFEKRLGEYTTTSYSLGSSYQRRNDSSSSTNVNLISRSLLKSDEIGMINRPYTLVTKAGTHPVITKLPDLSKWGYNQLLALGDKEYNTEFIKRKSELRITNKRVITDIPLWCVWDKYNFKRKGF